jgi:hypothetical protein
MPPGAAAGTCASVEDREILLGAGAPLSALFQTLEHMAWTHDRGSWVEEQLRSERCLAPNTAQGASVSEAPCRGAAVMILQHVFCSPRGSTDEGAILPSLPHGTAAQPTYLTFGSAAPGAVLAAHSSLGPVERHVWLG